MIQLVGLDSKNQIHERFEDQEPSYKGHDLYSRLMASKFLLLLHGYDFYNYYLNYIDFLF